MIRARAKKPSKTVKRTQRKAHALPEVTQHTVQDVSSQSSLPPTVAPPVTDPSTSAISVPEQMEAKAQKHKQYWLHLPANSKMRKKAAQIMALKIEGLDNDEIAKRVGLAPRSLRQYLWIAGKNGWLTVADPQEEVDYRLAHRAVSNLDELLHARDANTGMPDKEITLATLRGTGIFRTHDAPVAGIGNGQQNILQINIQTPTGPVTTIRAGSMQGAPAFVEGDLVGEKQPA